MRIKERNQSISVVVLCFFIGSCSSLSVLKFWGDEEEVELPAELQPIKQQITITKKWDKKLGEQDYSGRILPIIDDENVFYISSAGNLFALDKSKGVTIWSRKTGDKVSGALGVGFKRLFYGTMDGHVVSVDQENGQEIWRKRTSSEVLSPPVTNGSVVVAQSSDGMITGFDFKSGNKRWSHQSSVPRLSLRGTSIPFFEQGFIFAGFANGKIAMIYPDSGAVRWEIPIGMNEGKSELERIKDIDGKSILLGELLFSASYQGNIAAIDIRSGRPIWQEKFSTTRDLVEARSRVVAIDQKDLIKAFGSSTGVSVWQQEGLKLRNVSSPSVIKSNIVVGDFEGYLHFLSSKDGTFLARKKISSKSIKEIESEGNQLLVLDESGRLFSLLIQ